MRSFGISVCAALFLLIGCGGSQGTVDAASAVDGNVLDAPFTTGTPTVETTGST